MSNNTTKIHQFQSGMKAFISQIMGVLIGVIGILSAFLVSLLGDFDGDVSIKDKLGDGWFWVIWAVIFLIAISVAITTYRITRTEAKQSQDFQDARGKFLEAKTKAMDDIDLINIFTTDKNKEIANIIEIEFVESADLNYEKYKNGEYDIKALDRWQKKILKNHKKVKIKRLRGKDLTQEVDSGRANKVYSYLPQSERENERNFVLSKSVTRAINTFAFLIVGSLSFTMIGWVSAIINGVGILLTWVGAVLSAYDYVNTTLIARYVAKTDLLNEFVGLVPKYRLKASNITPEPILNKNEVEHHIDENGLKKIDFDLGGTSNENANSY